MAKAFLSTVPLSTEQRWLLLQLLSRRAGMLTTLQRQSLLEDAGLEHFMGKLAFGSPAEEFAAQRVRELQQAGLLPETGSRRWSPSCAKCAKSWRATRTKLPSWTSSLCPTRRQATPHVC